MSDYKPNLAKDGLDEHVERTNWLLIKTAGVFTVMAIVATLFSMWLSKEDPYVMIRWLDSRFIRIYFADAALLCLFQFIQVYTNGNALKRILQDSRSCAYWLSALILVNGLCLIGG